MVGSIITGDGKRTPIKVTFTIKPQANVPILQNKSKLNPIEFPLLKVTRTPWKP